MEHSQIKNLKESFRPVLEQGRNFFGKEAYDNHIIKILEYLGYSIEDKIIIEIFGKLERK